MVHITDKDKYKYINKFCKNTYCDVTGYNDDDNSSFVKTFPYGILKAYFSNILDNNHISDAVEGLGSNDFGIDAFFANLKALKNQQIKNLLENGFQTFIV